LESNRQLPSGKHAPILEQRGPWRLAATSMTEELVGQLKKTQIFNALDEAKYDWKSLNWQTVKKVELVELAVPVLREAKRLPKAMKVL
jgi:hypothetical protein